MGGYVRLALENAEVYRGISLWFDKSTIDAWKAPATGSRRLYSDFTIVTALRLCGVFRLPLRQTEAFVVSLVHR